jgi:anthranilate/para-aminobenzoate synthase component I
MSTEQATPNRVGESVAVQLDSHPIYGESAFAVFVRLREVYGDDQVCLLESLGGPEADSRRAFIGVSPLLDVTVRDAEIVLTGEKQLVDWANSRLSELATVSTSDGVHELSSRQSVWDALRHLQGGFDVRGADAHNFGFGFVTVFSYDAVMYI